MKPPRLILAAALFLAATGARAQTAAVPETAPGAGACLTVQPQGFVLPAADRVGFDVDDTILFSTPAFARGAASGHPFGSDAFWRTVNAADAEVSLVKQSVARIIQCYRDRGADIYVITARTDIGGDALREFLWRVLAIPPDHTYFEPKGKAARIKALKLDLFIGDGDGDIEDAGRAGAAALRVIRSPESSYRNKYHPGRYGETVIPCSGN